VCEPVAENLGSNWKTTICAKKY